MAWTEAAQAKYRRRTTRYESDLRASNNQAA